MVVMQSAWIKYSLGFIVASLLLFLFYSWLSLKFGVVEYQRENVTSSEMAIAKELVTESVEEPEWPLVLDTVEYDKRILNLVGYVPPAPITVYSTSTNETGKLVISTSTKPAVFPLQYSSTTNVTIKGKIWPPAAPYAQGGAIIPFERILAYYGNFYSRHMGILGEYEPEEVLRRLESTKVEWEAADPKTPIKLAIEYIAMVAQADAGTDGMYRAMMPEAEIEKAHKMAQGAEAILILDMQVGLSPIKDELPKFKKYLTRPDVHLAIDPEFSMKTGDRPGTVIGTVDATDVNYVINYLTEIVKENKLPPKILLVHRFTQNMVTNSAAIEPTPEVQVVMVMDGWGSKDLKRGTYSQVIEPEPVQFTGVKLFYKNDLKPPSTGLLTPTEVLQLNPKPIFIQYQ